MKYAPPLPSPYNLEVKEEIQKVLQDLRLLMHIHIEYKEVIAV